MDYQEALEYLDTFVDYEKSTTYKYTDFKLERMQKILERMGNPQNNFKSIHIAGTKGKGSTCAFMFSILKNAGYKVGLYTSPHLLNFRERIKISYVNDLGETRERLINEEEVCKVIEEIKPLTDEIKELTLFEVYTVMAFKFFSDMGMMFAILETGLGGRLDATNVVKPIICGITNISYDHVQVLGGDLTRIAQEKAGIIKEDAIVVSAPQSPEAFKVITEVCKQQKGRLYEVGSDFACDTIGQDLSGSFFDFRGIFDNYENLHISLIGQFQLINATLAIAIIQLLRLYDIVISLIAIKNGLDSAYWPGRMQLVHKNPNVIFDGAQNAASAHALKIAINQLITPGKSVLILGVSKDKDVEGICEHLCRQQSLIILTQGQSKRAMDVDTLASRIPRFQKVIRKTVHVEQALKLAVENAGPEDLILLTGSLYLVGEAFKVLKTINFSPSAKG